MIIDITGTLLTPGEEGKNCLGNGKHYDDGKLIECCCDECDYYCYCLPKDHKWYIPLQQLCQFYIQNILFWVF